MRINVGCGQTLTPGWRNIDNSLSICLAKVPVLPEFLRALRLIGNPQYQYIKFAYKNNIEYCDVTKKIPFPNGSVDVLYSSHMIEHLDREEVLLFLKEARRVLRPSGILRLAAPDINKQVQRYIKDGDADAFIDGTLLAQPRPRFFKQRIRLLLVGTRDHQWMYDGDSLCRLLTSNGFHNASIVTPGETRIPNPGLLDLFEGASESVYVEAENSNMA
jgi:predicted SAM-dependent methyltransferase